MNKSKHGDRDLKILLQLLTGRLQVEGLNILRWHGKSLVLFISNGSIYLKRGITNIIIPLRYNNEVKGFIWLSI